MRILPSRDRMTALAVEYGQLAAILATAAMIGVAWCCSIR